MAHGSAKPLQIAVLRLIRERLDDLIANPVKIQTSTKAARQNLPADKARVRKVPDEMLVWSARKNSPAVAEITFRSAG